MEGHISTACMIAVGSRNQSHTNQLLPVRIRGGQGQERTNENRNQRGSAAEWHKIWHTHTVSVDGDGDELLVMDILRDEEDEISKHVEDEAEIMILRNAIKKLSSRDQIIIKLLFGLENTEKKSQEEVASYFKVTQSIISRRKARSLRRLRTEMERYM